MKPLNIIICAIAIAISVKGQTNIVFTRLFSFDGTNGAIPYSGLMIGMDGNFYGTTCKGGDSNCGTIFRMNPNGKVNKLFSFDGLNGYWPNGELVQGHDGNLYGITTLSGNGYDSLHQQGAGTIFRIKCDGTGFTNLYMFDGMSQPIGGLAMGMDGKFYGVTTWGGAGNDGFVFRISSDGCFTNLLSYDFRKFSRALQGFVLGRDGNLYCTTSGGGKYDAGVLLRLETNGTFTVLASFPVMTNCWRVARNKLVQGIDGDFYGTTEFGGEYDNRRVGNENVGNGTFFKVTTNGFVKTLASFNGLNGAHPVGALVQTSDGTFYGVTLHDMAKVISQPQFNMLPTVPDADYTHGTIFTVTTNGDITRLYSFTQSTFEYAMTNGSAPCGLVQDSSGNFYGTTSLGGEKAHMAGPASGTIFKFRIESATGNRK